MNKIDQSTVAEINEGLSHGLIRGSLGREGGKGHMCMQSLIAHVMDEEHFNDTPSCVSHIIHDLSVWINDSLFGDEFMYYYLGLGYESHSIETEDLIKRTRADFVREYSIAQLGTNKAITSTYAGDLLFYGNLLMLSFFHAVIKTCKNITHYNSIISNEKNINIEKIYEISHFSEYSKENDRVEFYEYINEKAMDIRRNINDSRIGIDDSPMNPLESLFFSIAKEAGGNNMNMNHFNDKKLYVKLLNISNTFNSLMHTKTSVKPKVQLRVEFMSYVVKGFEFAGTEGSKYLYLVRGNSSE